MARIPSLASNNMYISRMLDAQENVFKTQLQLASEQKSQNYVGIANQSKSLVSIEIQQMKLEQYVVGNKSVQIGLNGTQNALQGMNDTIRDFRSIVSQFSQRDLGNLDPVEDAKYIEDMQQHAFDALKSMEFFLNQQVDDKYLFGGGRTTTMPVEFEYTNLKEFQAIYDGTYTTYPESRASSLSTFSVDGTTMNGVDVTQIGDTRLIEPGNDNAFLHGTINQAANTTGDVRFVSNGIGNDQIYSDVEGAFSSISAGDTIVIDNGGANSGVHYVDNVSEDGRTVTLKSTAAIADAVVANGSGLSVSKSYPVGTTIELNEIDPSVNGRYTVEAVQIDAGGKVSLSVGAEDLGGGPWSYAAASHHSISAVSYYKGDHLQMEHKTSEDRTVQIGINAEDSAFEKAIRAMGLLAQKDLIDPSDPAESERKIQMAMDLLNDSLDGTRSGTAMQNEVRSDIQLLQFSVSSKNDTIKNIVTIQEEQISYLKTRVGDIEGIDVTETATKLNKATTTLEIAYATLSKMNDLSLLNYLK